MDSAIDVLNTSAIVSPQQVVPPHSQSSAAASSMMSTVVHLPLDTTSIASNHNHMHASNIQHNGLSPDNQNVPKSMTSIPMSIHERKYELPAQFYPNVKKKRKIEESGFYRPPVVDKRPVFENLQNEHAILPDSYGTFECNLSWHTPTISTGGPPSTKWWV